LLSRRRAKRVVEDRNGAGQASVEALWRDAEFRKNTSGMLFVFATSMPRIRPVHFVQTEMSMVKSTSKFARVLSGTFADEHEAAASR
jgi:hypothetical protein